MNYIYSSEFGLKKLDFSIHLRPRFGAKLFYAQNLLYKNIRMSDELCR